MLTLKYTLMLDVMMNQK